MVYLMTVRGNRSSLRDLFQIHKCCFDSAWMRIDEAKLGAGKMAVI